MYTSCQAEVCAERERRALGRLSRAFLRWWSAAGGVLLFTIPPLLPYRFLFYWRSLRSSPLVARFEYQPRHVVRAARPPNDAGRARAHTPSPLPSPRSKNTFQSGFLSILYSIGAAAAALKLPARARAGLGAA